MPPPSSSGARLQCNSEHPDANKFFLIRKFMCSKWYHVRIQSGDIVNRVCVCAHDHVHRNHWEHRPCNDTINGRTRLFAVENEDIIQAFRVYQFDGILSQSERTRLCHCNEEWLCSLSPKITRKTIESPVQRCTHTFSDLRLPAGPAYLRPILSWLSLRVNHKTPTFFFGHIVYLMDSRIWNLVFLLRHFRAILLLLSFVFVIWRFFGCTKSLMHMSSMCFIFLIALDSTLN